MKTTETLSSYLKNVTPIATKELPMIVITHDDGAWHINMARQSDVYMPMAARYTTIDSAMSFVHRIMTFNKPVDNSERAKTLAMRSFLEEYRPEILEDAYANNAGVVILLSDARDIIALKALVVKKEVIYNAMDSDDTAYLAALIEAAQEA